MAILQEIYRLYQIEKEMQSEETERLPIIKFNPYLPNPGEIWELGNSFFLIVERKEIYQKTFFLAMKMSNYWELGTHEDLIVKIEEGSISFISSVWIIETWNTVYIPDDKFLLGAQKVGKISHSDFKTICDYLYHKIEKLPCVRGYVPKEDKHFVQNLFHAEEAEAVKPLKDAYDRWINQMEGLIKSVERELEELLPAAETKTKLVELANADVFSSE